MKLVCVLIAFVIVNCVSVKINSPETEKIISFSNIPSKHIESFEYRKTYWYVISWSITEEKLISDILAEQLENRPGARGIRNLEIYFFDEYYDSSQKLYRNPLIAAFSLFTSYAFNLYLTFKKSVLIRGEIFY